MPRVPRLQSRVERAPLPGARVAVDTPQGAFGVGSAVDLSGPIKLAAALAEQHRQEADDTQLVASDNQLHELKARVRQTVTQKYRGIDALGATDAARADWEKGVAEIGATIKAGDHVQQAFQKRAIAHWSDLLSTVDSHAVGEYKAAQTREFGSAIDNRISSAVESPDPARRQAAIDEGRTIISVWAQHSGWSPEETTQKLAAFTSDAHASVIERMVNEHQDLPAKQYLAEHKAELIGKDLIQAQRLTERASVLGESQRQSDRILASAQDLGTGLAEAAKITEPEVREATEHRIRQGFADKAAEQRQVRQEAFSQASAIVEKTHSYDAIPLTVRMAMTPEDNSALQRREDQIRHPKETGDSESYFHLLNMASLSPESRVAFANENLTAAGYPNLSDAQRQKLMTLQRSLSVRSEGVTTGHMAREAEAEQQRTDHLAEAELRKSDPAASETLRASNLAKRHATYHGSAAAAPTAGTEAHVTGHPPTNPLAGLLTPKQAPTRAMLEDIARKGPGYATYLRDMGYDIPAGTPLHPPVKQ